MNFRGKIVKVKKYNLLLIASLVWLIAGFNVLKIGVTTYSGYTTILNFGLSAVVFVLFWFMVFYKLTKKHTNRICAYTEEKQFFLNFFDVKSFITMIFMMSFGITARKINLFPDRFIAVFYTGLGTALFMAGLLFCLNYIKIKNKEGNNMAKKLMNSAIVYFSFAMAAGVFYREFSKMMGYNGVTVLKALHSHLLVLGMFLFILLAFACKLTNLAEQKLFKKFFVLYNISFPFMVIMMLVRGVLQVFSTEVTKGMNGMIAGFAGISHILMLVSFIMLLVSLKKSLTE